MVLILKFRTLDMVLGACDVVQCKNVGYYTIMFVYGDHETSLCPLDTTKGPIKGRGLTYYYFSFILLSRD